jgi:hypothetical protein
MSITGFKVGHYYRWIGPRNYCEDWTSEMELWKDGNARKCTAFDGLRAEFDGIEDCWYYGHCLQHFEDVASPSVETSKELTEREKLERIAAGSCKGFGCSGCPLFDFRMTSGGDPCLDAGHCGTKLAPRARARARELLCRTTESTFGITIPYLGSFRGELTSAGVGFTLSLLPQTLVEKRRATRRRLLGL